ncbi:MAG: SRPBCC domain-containing protein [Acidobacteriota bacterium]|nr:SRPBCC domain-containing protein [Acidobacteriota bacterium]
MPTSDAISPRNLSLQFNRLIPATAEQIYEAWTNPDLLKTWIAPGNMTVPAVKRNLRPGGAYRIEMKGSAAVHNGQQPLGSDDPVVIAEGVYTRLLPGNQLAYTWGGSWNPAEQSHVTVRLFEAPAGTTLTLDHDGFQSEQSLQVHHSGWQSSLTKLRELFSTN